MLKLPISMSSYTSPAFLSNMVQEQPMKMDIDAELGMPIDLSIIPGVFEGDESALFAPRDPVKLDPKDIALLKGTHDIQGAKLTSDSAFLRRTQYISSEIATSSKAKQVEAERAKRVKDAIRVELDPREQLLSVEKTFDLAQQSLENLRHPAKRGLKAVQAWPVVPNFDLSEQQYLNAKFPSNPAPRTKSRNVVSDKDVRLEVACMIPRIVDDTIDAPDNDYISYFIPDEETAQHVKSSNVEGSASGKTSKYGFVREYDARKDDNAAEWALVFHHDEAHYLELSSRMNMRGRRRGAQVTDVNEIIQLDFIDVKTDEQPFDMVADTTMSQPNNNTFTTHKSSEAKEDNSEQDEVDKMDLQ